MVAIKQRVDIKSNSHNTVGGIILAAGQSKRMGQPKLLLRHNGKPLLQHVVDAAVGTALSPVVVVLGCEAQRIGKNVDFKTAQVVFNPDFTMGQSTSLRVGLSVMPLSCSGVLFLLADQPMVDSATINKLIQSFKDSQKTIVVPVHNRRPGNPVLFGRIFFPQIATIQGDSGARALIETHHESIVFVEIGHDGIHLDVDTWQDYLTLTLHKKYGEK